MAARFLAIAVANEFGGVMIVVARQGPSTMFAALHEPLKGGAGRICEFRRIEHTEDSLSVAIVGEAGTGIDDKLTVRFGEPAAGPAGK